MSHLYRSLRDLYQGEIVITGESAMKPYDGYNDMAGPIEVEQVIHIFSQEKGFRDGDHPGLGRGRPFPETA